MHRVNYLSFDQVVLCPHDRYSIVMGDQQMALAYELDYSDPLLESQLLDQLSHPDVPNLETMFNFVLIYIDIPIVSS